MPRLRREGPDPDDFFRCRGIPSMSSSRWPIAIAMPRRRREGPEPDDFLPLPRDTFDVLVSLADRERHGYAILQDIAERTDGRIRLSPSTLYAVIKRLLESELIEELSERPDPAHDDERRRYYRLTPLGRRVAESEAARLTRLLADARASGLVPRRR